MANHFDLPKGLVRLKVNGLLKHLVTGLPIPRPMVRERVKAKHLGLEKQMAMDLMKAIATVRRFHLQTGSGMPTVRMIPKSMEILILMPKQKRMVKRILKLKARQMGIQKVKVKVMPILMNLRTGMLIQKLKEKLISTRKAKPKEMQKLKYLVILTEKQKLTQTEIEI